MTMPIRRRTRNVPSVGRNVDVPADSNGRNIIVVLLDTFIGFEVLTDSNAMVPAGVRV